MREQNPPARPSGHRRPSIGQRPGGHERPGTVWNGPPITVRCPCGERRVLGYVLLPAALIGWGMLLRPFHRRRYAEALGELPRWTLRHD